MVYYKCRKKTQAVIFSSYISPLFEKIARNRLYDKTLFFLIHKEKGSSL